MTRVPSPFGVALTVATAVSLSFLLLPIVAIFAELSLSELHDGLTSDVTLDALRFTVETNLVAMMLIVGFGTPTAYLLATRTFRGKVLLVTLVELPLVLPPAVAGIGLLAAFGRIGLLGGSLETLEIDIAFTKVAVGATLSTEMLELYVPTPPSLSTMAADTDSFPGPSSKVKIVVAVALAPA